MIFVGLLDLAVQKNLFLFCISLYNIRFLQIIIGYRCQSYLTSSRLFVKPQRKMLTNLCVMVSVGMLSIAAVVLCQDKITNKYTPDDNRIIKRLHGSPHAKVFLHGCNAEPYINLTANSTTESKQFTLQKSNEYLFAIFTLEEVSIIISNEKASSNAVSVWFNISECVVRQANVFILSCKF